MRMSREWGSSVEGDEMLITLSSLSLNCFSSLGRYNIAKETAGLKEACKALLWCSVGLLQQSLQWHGRVYRGGHFLLLLGYVLAAGFSRHSSEPAIHMDIRVLRSRGSSPLLRATHIICTKHTHRRASTSQSPHFPPTLYTPGGTRLLFKSLGT
jgi:hypothetical protein